MSASVSLEEATIQQQCKLLRMPTMAAQYAGLAEQAIRERRTHVGYLEALLAAEIEDRERHTRRAPNQGSASAASQNVGRL